MTALKNTKTEMQNMKILNGLSDIIDSYDHFIFDIWGVIHNGIAPFPHVIDCLVALKKQNKQILLLSNTPSVGTTIATDLIHMGVTEDMYDHIETAGDSARADIKARQGQKCWCAGQLHEESLVRGLDIPYVNKPDEADYMINAIYGNNETANDKNINLMQIAADRRLEMICPNPDKIVQVGDSLKLCPGTFAEIYENEMGGTVRYHGKPHGPIYRAARRKLGQPEKTRILAVGDSLHTDIQGANNFGIDCVFNLVGIHKEELQQKYGDDINNDILAEYIDDAAHKPEYILEGLRY